MYIVKSIEKRVSGNYRVITDQPDVAPGETHNFCSPDHIVVMENGSEIKVKDLKVNDKIIIF